MSVGCKGWDFGQRRIKGSDGPTCSKRYPEVKVDLRSAPSTNNVLSRERRRQSTAHGQGTPIVHLLCVTDTITRLFTLRTVS